MKIQIKKPSDHQNQHSKKQPYNRFAILSLTIILIGTSIYVAIFNEYVYRILMIGFLVGLAFSFHRKLDQLIASNREGSPIRTKDVESQQTTTLSESEIEQKKIELEKVDFDRTQILEELFLKAALDEEEKQQFRSKIKQKDNEMSGIMHELVNAKNVIQQAFLDTKKYFIKENPMKEVAASLNHDLALNGDITELNKELQNIQNLLSKETIRALEESSFIDSNFHLTRNGYKVLVKEIEKERT